VFRKIMAWLEEDIGIWDETTRTLFDDELEVVGSIQSQSSGTLACISDIDEFLTRIGFVTKRMKNDGDQIKDGDVLLEVRGKAKKLFEVERLVLNILAHTSGIATATRTIVESTKGHKVRIAATRKTIPGLRYFEKKSVLIGGGDPHRFNLDDAILIKRNHIKIIGSITEAIKRAKSGTSFTKKIEVEVTTPQDALEATKAGADIVMLDNVSVKQAKDTISLLEKKHVRQNVILEISGGIRPENAADYATAGADVLSSGYITMSAPALDICMKVRKL
jgi:nicotinate-nucleotide pyrophosphorylase (carboxylating)